MEIEAANVFVKIRERSVAIEAAKCGWLKSDKKAENLTPRKLGATNERRIKNSGKRQRCTTSHYNNSEDRQSH